MPLAALRRLIAHPIGIDRQPRPQHNDDVRPLQRFVDRSCEAATAFDQRVPPDGVPTPLQRRRQTLRLRLIAMGVAEKNRWLSGIARHMTAPEARAGLPLRTGTGKAAPKFRPPPAHILPLAGARTGP